MKKSKIVSYLTGFFMCVFLAMFALGSGAYFGFLTDDSLMIAFSETESFDAVREDILEGINYADAPRGFDVLVAENIITKDLVRNDVSGYIHDTLYNKEFEVDEELFENSFYGGIGSYYDKNLIVSFDDEAVLDSYLLTLKSYYDSCIRKVDLSDFVWAFQGYTNLALAAAGVGAVGAVLCMVILWFSVKNKRDRFYLYSSAGISGGIITMLYPTYMLYTQGYLNMQIGVEYLYNVTVAFIRNGFVNVNFCGGILLLAGIGCAVYEFIYLSD